MSGISTAGGQIDTTIAHPARRYDYWLGGKDNFAADRRSGDLIAEAFPTVREMARENRAFLRRAVAVLAGSGIRQFLDIGAGLPTAENTHQVAQAFAPESRVVYVDNDPMVLSHGRALLTGTSAFVAGDLRDPVGILGDPVLRQTVDLSRPVALLLVAVLHFLGDDAEAVRVVRTLVDALPAGSALVLTHATTDFSEPAAVARYHRMIEKGQVDAYPRAAAGLKEILDGLDLLDPGLVPVCDWRSRSMLSPADVALYAAVGIKR